MHGWFIDCIEKMVLAKFGQEIWTQVKERAQCTVEVGGWVRLQFYPDELCFELIKACSEVLNTDASQLFGQYFGGYYLIEHGYQNVLRCRNRFDDFVLEIV